MIDIEDDVIEVVEQALADHGYDIHVSNLPISAEDQFPCVQLEEIDNYIYQRTVDSGSRENHVVTAYELTVSSNKTYQARSESKRIFGIVSDTLVGMGFIRNSMQPIPVSEGTRYRYVGRFSAVVSKDKQIARR